MKRKGKKRKEKAQLGYFTGNNHFHNGDRKWND